jgi:hypothetical protein
MSAEVHGSRPPLLPAGCSATVAHGQQHRLHRRRLVALQDTRRRRALQCMVRLSIPASAVTCGQQALPPTSELLSVVASRQVLLLHHGSTTGRLASTVVLPLVRRAATATTSTQTRQPRRRGRASCVEALGRRGRRCLLILASVQQGCLASPRLMTTSQRRSMDGVEVPLRLAASRLLGAA